MKYRYLRKPYKHQVSALKKLLDNGFGGALLMSPRTGKTKVAIDYASILYQADKVERVLVVCPVSVMGVWIDEIRANCPFKYRITVWDKRGRDRYKLPTSKGVLDFVIINYEAFQTPGKILKSGRRSRATGRYLVRKKLKEWEYQLMILDESHRIKKWAGKRTKMIVSMGPTADYRVIMTGTAVTKAKRVFDLYPQWRFMYPESPLVKDMTLMDFKEKFTVRRQMDNYEQIVRVRNSKLLHRLVHEHSFAVDRDECFDLPPRMEQIIHVDLEESAPVYDEMAEKMVAQLKSGEITEASIRLVQVLRLAQITSGLATTTPTEEHPEKRLARVGSEKLRVLKELLSDLFEADQKVVICARFRGDIAAISQVVTELRTTKRILIGGMTRLDKDESWRTFAKLEGPAAFIMNPQAGGLGIDLSTAATMVWYSLTNSYVDFTQAQDRIALSRASTTMMYLLARNTVDELMYEMLLNDGDIAKAIVASPERLLRDFK